jgi:predicted ArsR family transcriptional regulator
MQAAMPELTSAKRRVLDHLKLLGPATVTEIAASLGLTDVAVRQHLAAAEELGLVSREIQAAAGPGRPPSLWRLAAAARELFPDRHGELSVGLLALLRRTFGEEGLGRLVAARADEQARQYAEILPPPAAPLRARLAALAAQRSREGYMAEVREETDGALLLIEHHCPICEAATACTGLCAAELDVFRRCLGPDVTVERTSHLVAGDPRCVYRVTRERGSPEHG